MPARGEAAFRRSRSGARGVNPISEMLLGRRETLERIRLRCEQTGRGPRPRPLISRRDCEWGQHGLQEPHDFTIHQSYFRQIEDDSPAFLGK